MAGSPRVAEPIDVGEANPRLGLPSFRGGAEPVALRRYGSVAAYGRTRA
ncbi:hypothetical protein [Salinispora arenicola]|nr:hypothetical protein [Salinispora arenicola]NIL64883.1 hypothetical protein [Salinispora arenicola]